MKHISLWEIAFPCLTSCGGLILLALGSTVGSVAFQCATFAALIGVGLVHSWQQRKPREAE